MIRQVVGEFPNLKIVATTLRHAKTATVNDWSAMAWCDGEFFEATPRANLEILDRLAAATPSRRLVYGFMMNRGPQWPSSAARPRRPGDDDARRHEHGDARRGGARDEGRHGAGVTLTHDHGKHWVQRDPRTAGSG